MSVEVPHKIEGIILTDYLEDKLVSGYLLPGKTTASCPQGRDLSVLF